MKKISETITIKRYSHGVWEEIEDEIVIEKLMTIVLNDRELITLSVLETDLDALAYGYLFSEGLIRSKDDVSEFSFDEETMTAYLRITEQPLRETGAYTNDSGDYRLTEVKYKEKAFDILPHIAWEAEQILDVMTDFLAPSELFERTGNVHSVVLVQDGKLVARGQDIGRFNAFDKGVGRALLLGIDLGTCMVVTSGRIPSAITKKTIHCGIPMIVSRSAPSNKSIALAKQYRLNMAGFAKPDRVNIYLDYR